MSSIQLTPVEPRSPGITEIPAVLLPHLKQRYAQRAARLRQLAEGHAMADYLSFAANVAAAQQRVLDEQPLPAACINDLAGRLGRAQPPLAYHDYPRDPYWQALLEQLIDLLTAEATPAVRTALETLRTQTPGQREQQASALLAGDYAAVDSGQAVFLWAALSLYFTQLAAHLPASAKALPGEARQHCPVCASAPVASVIMTGAQAGLRYLQCGLCE
ncbi:formate dehydrogenase accessory protein FdhE, partial [Pseudomonas laurentiana]|nr:formate dehydrogenase accessory protein FdhE [Pseudomonas laurentiana]